MAITNSVAMESLVRLLHEGGYSCVVRNRDSVHTFTKRGVADLLRIYEDAPGLLDGADIADKVVGKGAAALMVLGKVSRVYTDVISESALALLEKHSVSVTFGQITQRIMNRAKDGLCPVESLCYDLDSPSDMLMEIRNFIKDKKNG